MFKHYKAFKLLKEKETSYRRIIQSPMLLPFQLQYEDVSVICMCGRGLGVLRSDVAIRIDRGEAKGSAERLDRSP